MAIAHVDSTSEGSPDKRAVTTPAIVSTGADLLIAIVVGIEVTGAQWITVISGVSDSKSNTPWTWLGKQQFGEGVGARVLEIGYIVPSSVGSGHTLSVADPGFDWYGSVSFLAFTGAHASPLDTDTGTSQAESTSVNGGSITPAGNDELLISAVIGGFATIDTGFVGSGTPQIAEPGVAGQAVSHDTAYQIQTTGTTRNPLWSNGGGGLWCAVHAAFKAAGGGGGGTNKNRSLVGGGLVNTGQVNGGLVY